MQSKRQHNGNVPPDIHESIFQITSDGIIVVNTEGIIERINPAAAAMLSLTVDQAHKQSALNVFRDDPVLLPLFKKTSDYSGNVRLPRQRFGFVIVKMRRQRRAAGYDSGHHRAA